MSENETFEFEISTAYGQDIPTIKASAGYQKFDSIDEVRSAGEYPKDKEIVSMVNAKNKAAARAKETTRLLDANGYKKPDVTDDDFAVKSLMKTFQTRDKNMSDSVAEQKARAVLGL